jgi:amidase
MNIQRAQIVKKYHDIILEHSLDAIIMPGYQAVAPKHDKYGVPIYTVLQNLLNYPAGILPFGKAEREKDEAFVKEGVRYEPAYDTEASEGMLAHVQVVGKPMMDEELLGIMGIVENVLNAAEEP